MFPGVHHHSEFAVEDHGGRISIRVIAKDFADPLVEIEATESELFPETSAFPSLGASSEFSQRCCVGYSSRPGSRSLDGLLLKVPDWRVSPLSVDRVSSAYYDDRSTFPAGSIRLDHALLMRDIQHEWHAEPMMVA